MLQGSIKTGILGEILLNLSNFLNLVDPTAISLPLKKCNSGTVLQVSEFCVIVLFESSFGGSMLIHIIRSFPRTASYMIGAGSLSY
jgi:hypothetical protein